MVFDLLDYAVAIFAAAVAWICGLGMLCTVASTKSGVIVTMHGWTCQCNDGSI